MTGAVAVDAGLALTWVIAESFSAEAATLLAGWERDGVRRLASSLLGYEAIGVLYRKSLVEEWLLAGRRPSRMPWQRR